MKTDSKLTRSVVRLAMGTMLLLSVPLVAMRFTEEVVWTLSDFIFAGFLLFGTGLACLLITRTSKNVVYRLAAGITLLTGLLLIWVNGAVGIIGSGNNEINLLYSAVIGVGGIGALVTRFRAKGMVRTLFAMAITQAIVAGIALYAGMAGLPDSSVIEIIGINLFFILLFVASAVLFRYAAGKPVTT